MALQPFDVPIPGQSLTMTPKNAPWERPPEMTDVKDVIDDYIDTISSEEVVDDLLMMLKLNVPIEPIVESLTSLGIYKGKHSPDVKLLVAPVIHKYIELIAKKAGIPVRDSIAEDKTKAKQERDENRVKVLLMKKLESMPDTTEPDLGMDLAEQTLGALGDTAMEEPSMEEPSMDTPIDAPQEQTPEVPEPSMEEPSGLMSRRTS